MRENGYPGAFLGAMLLLLLSSAGLHCGLALGREADVTSEDAYAILGVERSASLEEIKSAYRKAMRTYHPDAHADALPAEKMRLEEIAKKVGNAYGVLGSPQRRADYDQGLIDLQGKKRKAPARPSPAPPRSQAWDDFRSHRPNFQGALEIIYAQRGYEDGLLPLLIEMLSDDRQSTQTERLELLRLAAKVKNPQRPDLSLAEDLLKKLFERRSAGASIPLHPLISAFVFVRYEGGQEAYDTLERLERAANFAPPHIAERNRIRDLARKEKVSLAAEDPRIATNRWQRLRNSCASIFGGLGNL